MGRRQSPWRTIRTRTGYRDRYLSVRVDDVWRPDGRRGTYAYVDHRGAVGVAAVDAQRRIVLVREYKYPVRAWGLHLPSGHIDRHETPRAAAARELREETGVSAARWRSLGTLAVSDGTSREIGHLFLARTLTIAPRSAAPEEPLSIVRIPLARAVRMVLDGRITCSYAIAGIIRAAAVCRVIRVTR